MSKMLTAGLLVVSSFIIAGYDDSESRAAEPMPTLFESMTQVIDPQSQAFWNSSFDAMNDSGDIVPSKLTDEQRNTMRAAAVSVRDHARQFAEAKRVMVAAEGVKILNEGTQGALGAGQVQALIDADPEGFAAQARELVKITDNLVAGLDAGDMAVLNQAAVRFNDVCTECHSKYWYPEQK